MISMNFSSRLILSLVRPVVVTDHLASRIRSSSGIGRGVVVTSARALGPRRSDICRLSHALSACLHLASSSAQPKSNSGPRNPSALSPENSCASLPFGQRSRPTLGSQLSFRRSRLATLTSPLTPSTMMLRASPMVAPTNATRTPGLALASRKIHSAPALVLPKPRPASISHTRQPSPFGGSWLSCAHCSKSASYFSACSNVRLLIVRRCCSSVAFASILCS